MYFVWGTYTADELILERFGLRHTNTWGIHHVIWLTNICIFPKVDRWGRIYFGTVCGSLQSSLVVRLPAPRCAGQAGGQSAGFALSLA